MVNNHVVWEGKDNDDIRLQDFYFYLFDEDKEGVVRDGFSEYPYLLILMKLWNRYWKNQLEGINMKVDEENDKAAEMVNGLAQEV